MDFVFVFVFSLERIFKSSRPILHVIDKITHCSPEVGRDLPMVIQQRKGIGGPEAMVAKSHFSKHPTKIIFLEQNVSFRLCCLLQGSNHSQENPLQAMWTIPPFLFIKRNWTHRQSWSLYRPDSIPTTQFPEVGKTCGLKLPQRTASPSWADDCDSWSLVLLGSVPIQPVKTAPLLLPSQMDVERISHPLLVLTQKDFTEHLLRTSAPGVDKGWMLRRTVWAQPAVGTHLEMS